MSIKKYHRRWLSATATPLIGELPFIGVLFRAKKETSNRDEVILLLTPYVLEPGRMGGGPAQRCAGLRIQP